MSRFSRTKPRAARGERVELHESPGRQLLPIRTRVVTHDQRDATTRLDAAMQD